MSKVFLSWYDGQDHSLANEFFGLLKQHEFTVEHSPFSPHSGFVDTRWINWYKSGLPQAIQWAELFIAVLTPSCSGSTWMMQEYEEAFSSFMKSKHPLLYYIRFDTSDDRLNYPDYYLKSSIQLSSVPEEAVRKLLLSHY